LERCGDLNINCGREKMNESVFEVVVERGGGVKRWNTEMYVLWTAI